MGRFRMNRLLLIVVVLIAIIIAIQFVIITTFLSHRESRSATGNTIDKISEEIVAITGVESRHVRVDFRLPENSRTKTAKAQVVNNRGKVYNYTIFKQGAGYDSHSDYLKNHGCSTCALASVLGAVSDDLYGVTPDRVIEEIEEPILACKIGESQEMPISLVGMIKIFDECDIKYKRPSNSKDLETCEKELTRHLEAGNPAIVTFGNGKAGHLSAGVHTVILMGIDCEGYVIIGDSILKSKKYWDKMGLVKRDKMTIKEVLSFIKSDDWDVCQEEKNASNFYAGKCSQGYLLVYK